MKLTEFYIQKNLFRYFKHHKFYLFNAFIFQNSNESDYFSINSSGYSLEGEIKLSYSDFKADFKKDRNRIYEKCNGKEVIQVKDAINYNKAIIDFDKKKNKERQLACSVYFKKVKNFIPNYFFYICPENLIDISELNDKTGLYYIKPINNKLARIEVIKKPKFLHKNKFDNFGLLAQKYYYKFALPYYKTV